MFLANKTKNQFVILLVLGVTFSCSNSVENDKDNTQLNHTENAELINSYTLNQTINGKTFSYNIEKTQLDVLCRKNAINEEFTWEFFSYDFMKENGGSNDFKGSISIRKKSEEPFELNEMPKFIPVHHKYSNSEWEFYMNYFSNGESYNGSYYLIETDSTSYISIKSFKNNIIDAEIFHVSEKGDTIQGNVKLPTSHKN